EPAPRVLRPLGDARDLPVLLGDEGDDAVRLAVGAGTEHERGGREFTGHGAASTPSSPMPHGATSRNLDKRGFGPYLHPAHGATGSPWSRASRWCSNPCSTCSSGTASSGSRPRGRPSIPRSTRPWRTSRAPSTSRTR